MKMKPIVSSETSAIRTQTPGNYPKRNKLHLEHGESLKTRLKAKVFKTTVIHDLDNGNEDTGSCSNHGRPQPTAPFAYLNLHMFLSVCFH